MSKEDKNLKSYQVSHQYDQCAEKILKVFIVKLLMNLLLKVASDVPEQRQDAYKSAECLVMLRQRMIGGEKYYSKQIK